MNLSDPGLPKVIRRFPEASGGALVHVSAMALRTVWVPTGLAALRAAGVTTCGGMGP